MCPRLPYLMFEGFRAEGIVTRVHTVPPWYWPVARPSFKHFLSPGIPPFYMAACHCVPEGIRTRARRQLCAEAVNTQNAK